MTMSDDLDIEMEEEIVAPPKLIGNEALPPLPLKEEEQDPIVGHLEDEAKKRKERLRGLKQKLVGGGSEDNEVRKGDGPGPLPKPVFRSYNPSDEKFQEIAVPKAKVIDVEEQIQDTLEHGIVKPVVEDVDLTSLAPRKPDWDLKRDVAPKLTKLERRTQRAIAELILDRLKSDKQGLAAAVGFTENQQRGDEDDED